MVSKTRAVLAMTAFAVGSIFAAVPVQADVLNGWFGPQYVAYRPIFPRRAWVAYAPATPVAVTPTVAWSPVATGCNTCATTVPVTTFRPVAVSVPVTTFRPEIACNACGGATTVLRPVTMMTQQVQFQPVTTFQPVVTQSFMAPACSTCAVQTAAFAAPACSTCGGATAGCASGNCGVNVGSVSSFAPSYQVAPTSTFEPAPVAVPSPTPVPSTTPMPSAAPTGQHYHVPATTPETPTPNIAPQSVIPRTQVEPAEVTPENSGALKPPAAFHESATQQPYPRLRPVPHLGQETGDHSPAPRPQLVDPQDKTARAQTGYEVKQAVYSNLAPVSPAHVGYAAVAPSTVAPITIAPRPVAPSQSVLTQRGASQEEIDAEGWAPAKR